MSSQERKSAACRLLAIVAAVVLLSAAQHSGSGVFTARAQSGSASLSVTVMDERRAVVPGVNMTLLNLNTALQRHARTDEQGTCVVPLLPPGSYNVTAQHNGFTTVEVRRVALSTGDLLSLRINLKVGEIGEAVTVIENASSIQQSPAISTVVNRNFVGNLPLNGRSFQSLFELTPGVVLTRSTFNERDSSASMGKGLMPTILWLMASAPTSE